MDHLTADDESELEPFQGRNAGETGLVHPLSMSKFMVMYLCTCGLYIIYWYYRSQRCIKQQTGSNANLFLRTLAFLIPGVNLYMLYRMLRDDVELLRLKLGGQLLINNPIIPVFEYAACVGIGLAGFIPGVPRLARLVLFLSFFPIRKMQMILNLYLARIPHRLNDEYRFSATEIVFCIIGIAGALWYIAEAVSGLLERTFSGSNPNF